MFIWRKSERFCKMFEVESGGKMENAVEPFLSIYLNATIELLLLISIHFQTTTFNVLHAGQSTSDLFEFQKKTSRHNLAVSFRVWDGRETQVGKAKEAVVVFDRSQSDLEKLINGQPKMILAIAAPSKISKFLANDSKDDFMIPETMKFFLVSLGRPKSLPSSISGKLYDLHKPSRMVKMKAFPMLSYDRLNSGTNEFQWTNLTLNWHSYEKEMHNLSGALINIGFTLPQEYMNNTDYIQIEFWKNTHTAFFWRELQGAFGFRPQFCFDNYTKKKSEFYRSLFFKCAEAFSLLTVISSSRSNSIADFIYTGIDVRHLILVAPPRYEYSWFSIFKPFTLESWIVLSVFILLMPLILRLVASTSLDLSSSFLTIIGIICCQGSDKTPRNLAPRLVCCCTLIFSFSIYQFYTSNLYSLLSIKEKKLPFNSLEEYVELKPYPLYTLPQSPLHDTIMSAESGAFKRLREEIWSKHPTYSFQGFQLIELVKKVCRGEATIFGVPFQLQYVKEFPCKLVQINTGYLPSSLGLLIKKGFPYKNQFTLMSLRFLEIGITRKYINEYISPDFKAPTRKMAHKNPIDMQQVFLLFLIYMLFILLSLLILCAEIFYAKSFSTAAKFHRSSSNSIRLVRGAPLR